MCFLDIARPKILGRDMPPRMHAMKFSISEDTVASIAKATKHPPT